VDLELGFFGVCGPAGLFALVVFAGLASLSLVVGWLYESENAAAKMSGSPPPRPEWAVFTFYALAFNAVFNFLTATIHWRKNAMAVEGHLRKAMRIERKEEAKPSSKFSRAKYVRAHAGERMCERAYVRASGGGRRAKQPASRQGHTKD
jgi:hypothetical protein